jgi:hypothetical protein
MLKCVLRLSFTGVGYVSGRHPPVWAVSCFGSGYRQFLILSLTEVQLYDYRLPINIT